MIDYDDYFGGLTREEYEEQTKEHFEWLKNNCKMGIVDTDEVNYMSKIMKIAEVKASDTESLKKIVKALEDAEFTVIYDKEYEQYAYVCVKENSN